MPELLDSEIRRCSVRSSQGSNLLCKKLGGDWHARVDKGASCHSDKNEGSLHGLVEQGKHSGMPFQERALRVIKPFRHHGSPFKDVVLIAAGRVVSPGSIPILRPEVARRQFSGMSSAGVKIRPAPASRPSRPAGPRPSSSLGAGWLFFRRLLRRHPIAISDVIGVIALFLMIWPYIL